MHNIYIYILVMFLVSISLRTLPVILIKKPIKSKFIKSFLYYVPYVTLSVMTVPAIIEVTDNPIIGFISLVACIIFSYIKESVFLTAILASSLVLVLQYIF